jgi:multidrug efflux pump subunit AcrA (membrane-fusion protein)
MRNKVVSLREFEEKEAATDARRAEVSVAQTRITRLQELQRSQKIVSPFAGVITAININNGALVPTEGGGESPEHFRVVTSRSYSSTSTSRRRTRP